MNKYCAFLGKLMLFLLFLMNDFFVISKFFFLSF